MEIETDLDVDRGFLHDLREVRILLDKEKEHKHLVCSQLKVIISRVHSVSCQDV